MKKKRKKREEKVKCFTMHRVHSDTLYVKNRRNKSEKKNKKKTSAATVKNPRVMRKKKI